jgi:hypothetical protein
VPQAKSCHPERSKIIREANDLAESRDLLFALATTTRVERTLLSAAFDVARHHPIGVIPSAALLQAERDLRASTRPPAQSLHSWSKVQNELPSPSPGGATDNSPEPALSEVEGT